MSKAKQLAKVVVAGAALAVAATGAAGTAPASAGTLTDCFVTTNTVPAYDYPNHNIVVWVNQGQGLFLTQISGAWRKGNLWGGPANVWIHSNYLRC